MRVAHNKADTPEKVRANIYRNVAVRLDCVSKKRHAFGSRSPNAVLSDAEVLEIKRAHTAGTLNQREAARKLGVSWGLIGHIVHGRAWTHI